MKLLGEPDTRDGPDWRIDPEATKAANAATAETSASTPKTQLPTTSGNRRVSPFTRAEYFDARTQTQVVN